MRRTVQIGCAGRGAGVGGIHHILALAIAGALAAGCSGATPGDPAADDLGDALSASSASMTVRFTAGALDVSWPAATGATGYVLYRGTSRNGPFSPLTSSPILATSWRDVSVVAGQAYWYGVAAVLASGQGAMSPPLGLKVPAAVTIYNDGTENGWSDVSNADHTEVTSPVRQGTSSDAVTFGPWKVIALAHPGYTTNAYGNVTLYVNAGAADAPPLQVRALLADGTLTDGAALAPRCTSGTLPANTWKKCVVPLSDFGAANATVTVLYVQEWSGSTSGTLYFDGIQLAGKGTPSPAPAQTITVAVSPSSASIAPQATLALTASVTGTANAGVSWSVQEGASGGTVTDAGVYTAPATAGTYHVVATSQADTSRSGMATVTVTAPAPTPTVAVSVSPATASIATGATISLAATVTGTANTSVTWSIVEGAAGGAVTAAGVYTAPATAGTYHVVATSAVDPTKTGSAVVTVADQPVATATLGISGRHLVDTCGNAVVVRGVEQPLGWGFDISGGDFLSLVDQIALTGANAVRFLPDMGSGQPDWSLYDAAIGRAVSHGMIVYLSYQGWSGTRAQFWARADVHATVTRYQKSIIIDAFQETEYDDRVRWHSDALAAIASIRSQGYTVPITVMANQYGRDLPSLLQDGAAIVAADPLGKTILGWQAYWGSSGVYQSGYGGQQGLANPTSIADGIAAVAQRSFPIQVGLDYITDPGETADYQSGMSAAQTNGVGWLWWAYYHPFDSAPWGPNGVTTDGYATHLRSPFGPVVVNTGAGAISTTSVKACGR